MHSAVTTAERLGRWLLIAACLYFAWQCWRVEEWGWVGLWVALAAVARWRG